jgi:hypothetical protein
MSKKTKETVRATPTKRFFVDMLTRDIELHDAILDLLDNCVDGILRSQRSKIEANLPYDGFWAKISFNQKKFRIIDNCGGIPLELAKKYAFMMGRPKDEDDSDIPTVGMYGIGMKRAIFKIGTSSYVLSQSKENCFEVSISSKWMQNDLEWDLPLKHIDNELEEDGTLINVENLKEGISTLLAVDGTSPFEQDLVDLISHHYGFIISKGFKVFVNEKEVPQKPISILWSSPGTPEDKRIQPYIYQANIDGLNIRLVVGFYTAMLSQDDLDEEQITRRSKEDAGWTIMCNDRVVLHNDKTRLTGWGEAGVPAYHSQFIGISGTVMFTSNDAWKLPVTTTKRGIDTSSEIYLYVKEFMREGLKKFTSYTNSWKQDPEKEKEISKLARSVPLENIFSIMPDKSWTKVRNSSNEFKLNLALAKPTESNPRRQIRFTKPLSEIELISEFFYGNTAATPAEIGEACFDQILNKVKK